MSSEYDELQIEEIEGIVGMYGDDITITNNTSPRSLEIKVSQRTMYITLPKGYPEEESLQVRISEGGKRGREITKRLKDITESNKGCPSILCIIDEFNSTSEVELSEEVGQTSDDESDDPEPSIGTSGGWIVSETPTLTKIAVDVKPGRPQTVITNPTDLRRRKADSIQIDVAAPARLGAANKELFKYLSRHLSVPREDIEFGSSRKTRSKCLAIKGVSAVDLNERMIAHVS